MALTIDLVLVVYNNYELTDTCLRHLAAQDREHRVIVVDHGSTDETRERLHRDWSEHTIVEIDQNGALSAACNLGVAAGSGDVIVWINNDVYPRPDFLRQIVAPFEIEDRVGSACGLTVRPDEETIDGIGLSADRTLAGFSRLQGLPAARATDARPVTVGPSGTAAAYRRSAYEQLGGLDERISSYSEDLDLALRLRAAGWATATAPAAVGMHLGSATHGHRSTRQRALGGWSRGYLLRRYGVLRTRAAIRALATEVIVCAADLAISRDLAATKGRVRGWRAAKGLPRHSWPPPDAIEASMSFRDSLAARRGAYAPR